MATVAPSDAPLDVREQVVRIDKMQSELAKVQVEITKIVADTSKTQLDINKTKLDMRLAPWTAVFTGLGAGAALFAAGIAFAKLFIS